MYQKTPIQCALECGHLDVFKFLLNKGAKVTSEDLVSSIECILVITVVKDFNV